MDETQAVRVFDITQIEYTPEGPKWYTLPIRARAEGEARSLARRYVRNINSALADKRRFGGWHGLRDAENMGATDYVVMPEGARPYSR